MRTYGFVTWPTGGRRGGLEGYQREERHPRPSRPRPWSPPCWSWRPQIELESAEHAPACGHGAREPEVERLPDLRAGAPQALSHRGHNRCRLPGPLAAARRGREARHGLQSRLGRKNREERKEKEGKKINKIYSWQVGPIF